MVLSMPSCLDEMRFPCLECHNAWELYRLNPLHAKDKTCEKWIEPWNSRKKQSRLMHVAAVPRAASSATRDEHDVTDIAVIPTDIPEEEEPVT